MAPCQKPGVALEGFPFKGSVSLKIPLDNIPADPHFLAHVCEKPRFLFMVASNLIWADLSRPPHFLSNRG